MKTVWSRLALAVLTTVVMTSGCTSEGGPADGSPSSPSPPKIAIDPPLAFVAEGVFLGEPSARHYVPGRGLPSYFTRGRFVTDQQTVYYFKEEPRKAVDFSTLTAVDLSTGNTRWSWDSMVKTSDYVSSFSRSMLVVAEIVTVKGVGTTADYQLTRVTAIGTADGSPVWTVDLREDVLPGAQSTLLGATDNHILVKSGNKVVVLDAATGSIRSQWGTTATYESASLVGDVIVGVEGESILFGDDTRVVTGRAVADGQQLWTREDPSSDVMTLSPDLVAVVGRSETSGSGSMTVIVDVASGQVRATLKTGYFCWDDMDSTIVCQNNRFYSFDDHVIAMDRGSGETLWEFPAPGRKTPNIALARRGAIYAETDNGALILDARTGADKVTSLPFTPDRVIPGYVFTFNDSGVLYAHRAIAP